MIYGLYVVKVHIEERRGGLASRSQNTEIRVGDGDMNDGATQQSNELCFKQPGEGNHLTWIYECPKPLFGRYVVYYKEQHYGVCANGSNCFNVMELIVFKL